MSNSKELCPAAALVQNFGHIYYDRTPQFQVATRRSERIILSLLEYLQVFNDDDCLCGLVVRVNGYRSGGPGLIPGTTRKKVVLKLGALSPVSTTDELFDRKVAAPV
jgi:hypothetical protein